MIPSLAGRAAAAARWGFGVWRFGRQAPEVAPTPPTNNNPRPAAPPEAATPAPAEKPALLPVEGEVGTFGGLREVIEPGSNLARHHMPNNQYMRAHGVPRNDGVAMMVEHPIQRPGGRHREIHRTLPSQDTSLDPRQALAQSVQRAREVYQQEGLYQEIRPSLQEVIQKNKELHPELFAKKG
ncbi:MAG: hypothetical protein WCG04_07295, partial [Alphaproteobacteria bacterium]